MNHPFNFSTSYNTFFITSDNGAAITDGWVEKQESYDKDRLFQSKNLLAVKTGSYGHIKGEICMLMNENKQVDIKNYDHIVEGFLEAKSGVLRILECPGSQSKLEIKVNPSTYKVRVYSSNLDSVDIDEDEGNDSYKIEIWPDSSKGGKVLKRYVPKF
jgi:hypothetical protein